ncbi:hypothetical protein GCM10007906_03290 [Vibrio hyugaensis]|uniref:Uncharacterized protein n=1 Tax=Vibrio hyugaensis TaxID=1534743 RepID=A0ABQ5XWT2_9VIBR|nr:hypothetical protein GCM10007906_03290 [Vibrio hyugaensis]
MSEGIPEGARCSFESVGVSLDSSQKPIVIILPTREALVCSTILIDEIFFQNYQWNE